MLNKKYNAELTKFEEKYHDTYYQNQAQNKVSDDHVDLCNIHDCRFKI